MTTNERIDELKNALQGALLVPSECAFVSTEIIKICIETLEKSKGDKWYQHGRTDGRADAIEFISDKLIYQLLDECDRGLWEHISYIELAEEWIKVLNDNPYPKVKNHTEARKRDLRKWITEQLKEQNK